MLHRQETGRGPGEEFRIVHISDLHFTGRPLTEVNKPFWKLFHLDNISVDNLKLLLNDIAAQKPNHVVVTGDVTNTAHPDEFAKAKNWLLQLQMACGVTGIGHDELDPGFVTVVPGNHDVSRKPGWWSRRKAETSRLREFIRFFGSTLAINEANTYDIAAGFPAHKTLFGCVDIFALNSTLDVPVHVIGVNSVGEIGYDQRLRLHTLIERVSTEGRFRIVLLHHHPLTIPYKPDQWDQFLVMRDARELLRTCFDKRIHLVLHGHKHIPFVWSNEVIPELDPPHKMVVIAAGSPTFERPGSSLIYNRYIAIRRSTQQGPRIDEVRIATRRFDPRQGAFVDLNEPIPLHAQLIPPAQFRSAERPPQASSTMAASAQEKESSEQEVLSASASPGRPASQS